MQAKLFAALVACGRHKDVAAHKRGEHRGDGGVREKLATRLGLDAIQQRDYPMIQGFVLYAGAAFAAINLLVDLAYGAIDPRISTAGRGAGGTAS